MTSQNKAHQSMLWMEKTPTIITISPKERSLTSENYKKQITQRLVKNLLDLQLLQMVKNEPLWGYRIKKQVEANYHIKLRHGALYPALNSLERKGFLESQKQQKDGRARKVYTLTPQGTEYLRTYHCVLKEQLGNSDL